MCVSCCVFSSILRGKEKKKKSKYTTHTMFEGSVSEQLHQFLTPRTPPPPPSPPPPPPPPNPNSLPLPLNFALHSPNFNFHPFDSYNSTTTHQIYLHHDLFHQKDDETRTTTTGNLQVAMDLDVGRSILMDDHHHHNHHHRQWSNDELLALLTIRSNIDNCFHESTWEHVSRSSNSSSSSCFLFSNHIFRSRFVCFFVWKI